MAMNELRHSHPDTCWRMFNVTVSPTAYHHHRHCFISSEWLLSYTKVLLKWVWSVSLYMRILLSAANSITFAKRLDYKPLSRKKIWWCLAILILRSISKSFFLRQHILQILNYSTGPNGLVSGRFMQTSSIVNTTWQASEWTLIVIWWGLGGPWNKRQSVS